MLLNKIQYAEEVPVTVPALAFRLFRTSWDGMGWDGLVIREIV